MDKKVKFKDAFEDYWMALISETHKDVVNDVANHYSNFIKKIFTKFGITRLDDVNLVFYVMMEDMRYKKLIVRTIEYDTKDDIINVHYVYEDSDKVSIKSLLEFAANNDDTFATLEAISSSVIMNIGEKYKDRFENIFRKINGQYEQV